MKQIISNKKVLFLGFIIVIVVLSALLQIFFGGKEQIIPAPIPSATPSILSRPTYVAPTLTDPNNPPFTGERDVPVPTEYTYVNSAYDLRAKLPYSQGEFLISYDYKRFVFVVTIQAPFEKNKAVFDAWITANGYSTIPQDQFVVNR